MPEFPHWLYNMCMWGMNLGIFGTLILECKESGDILYSYDLINPPNSQKSSESQAKLKKKGKKKPEENLPASYIACRCLYIKETGSPVIGLHRTMRHTRGWWPRKRHSACDFPPSLVPVLHAAVMGNEPAPAFLKRKHKAEFNQEVNNELRGKNTSHSPVS